MAYDKNLEERLDRLIAGRDDIHKQKMFGGLGYLLGGNMCFAIWNDSFILRLGEDQAERALTKKNVRPFDITGRAMKGWVMVAPSGMRTAAVLRQWVDQAIGFVVQLPRK